MNSPTNKRAGRFHHRVAIRHVAALACLVSGPALPTGWAVAGDAASASSATHPAPRFLRVQVAHDLVTLSTQGLPIKDVLKAVAQQSGLFIVLHGSLDQPITMDFNRIPLPEAIGRILRHYNFALHHAQPDTDSGKSGGASKLWVFSNGAGYFSSREPSAEQVSPNELVAFDSLAPEPIRTDGRVGHTTNEDQNGIGTGDAFVALTDVDEKVRLDAVRLLAEIGSEQAGALLIGVLGDESAQVRAEAANALGERGGDTAIPILQGMLHDADGVVRETAIDALTDIGGAESARVLSAFLDNAEASMREQTVEALAVIGGPIATQALLRAMEDKEYDVRKVAIHALADIGDEDAVRAITRALDDEELSLRQEAARALAELSGNAARPAPDSTR